MYFTEHVPLAASPHPPAWQSASQLIVEVLQTSKVTNGLVGWLVPAKRGFLFGYIFGTTSIYIPLKNGEVEKTKHPTNNKTSPSKKKAFNLLNKKNLRLSSGLVLS